MGHPRQRHVAGRDRPTSRRGCGHQRCWPDRLSGPVPSARRRHTPLSADRVRVGRAQLEPSRERTGCRGRLHHENTHPRLRTAYRNIQPARSLTPGSTPAIRPVQRQNYERRDRQPLQRSPGLRITRTAPWTRWILRRRSHTDLTPPFSTWCSNPAEDSCTSGRSGRVDTKNRTEKRRNGNIWTNCRVIGDREAPGSNPGPPTFSRPNFPYLKRLDRSRRSKAGIQRFGGAVMTDNGAPARTYAL